MRQGDTPKHLGGPPPVVVGDFNGDGDVDGDDYDAWQAAFGTSGASLADGNDDQQVNAADYPVWRNSLGQTSASGAGDTSVAEPVSTLLVLFACVTLGIARQLPARRQPARGEDFL